MPMLDMPVNELENYNGISPCPEDFDEYWGKALEEMKAVETKMELVRFDFPSKCAELYDLYFTGTKGARIHAKFARPKNTDGKIPAVIGFHGLGGDSGDWVGLLKYVSQGFAIAFLDVRGQAGLSEDAGGVGGTTIANPFVRGLDGDKHDLLMRDVYLDTALLARIVMGLDYVDENRIGVFGGSQGGCLSVVCAALVPQIKKCAPTYPYLADFKRVWEMDLDKDAYDGLRFYFRSYDPTHERENEIFERLGYIDIQNLAKRIKAEVLMSTGLQDNICPPSTQYAVYNKIKSKKTHIIYPDFGHEWLKGNDDLVFEFMSDL